MTEAWLARIRNKAGQWLNAEVDSIVKFNEESDNTVFKITAGGKPYIFKIYTLRDWPEDDKLVFIHQQLIEHGIRCAKIVAFDRNDPDFPSGYLIEECLPGTAADQAIVDAESRRTFYEKLARLMTQVHRIQIRNYGFIGSGTGAHGSFLEFVSDRLDHTVQRLLDKKLFDERDLLEIRQRLLHNLRPCEDLPAVLNHGDLTTKNVLINDQGELFLIDWDDAMSNVWMADIARMTYWLKYENDYASYAMYKNVFLRRYNDGRSALEFETLENAFHVWFGLDHLLYYADRPNKMHQYERALAFFNANVAALDGMQGP